MAAYHTDIDEVTAAAVQLRRDFHACYTLAEQAARATTNAFAQLLTVRPVIYSRSMRHTADPFLGP